MLCAFCIWQIPTEKNPACNFHWHNDCDCITLLKIYCFLGGGGQKKKEGKGHAFISLVEFVNLLKYYQISLLVTSYLSAKAELGFGAGWRAVRRGVHDGQLCHQGQGPTMPPTDHCRDLCSQMPLPLGTPSLESYVKSRQI